MKILKLTKENMFATVVKDLLTKKSQVVINFFPRALPVYITNDEKVAEVECEYINWIIETQGFDLVNKREMLFDFRKEKGE